MSHSLKKNVSINSPVVLVDPSEKIKQIAVSLRHLSLANRPGFSSGQLGPFLFLYSYALHTGCTMSAAAAQQHLRAAVECFLTLAPSPSYHRENAEFGMLLLHLRERDYIDQSFDALLMQVDLRANQNLQLLMEQRQFDPFVGYLSLAHYFLKRQATKPASVEPLQRVINTLLGDYQPQADSKAGFWFSYLFGKRQVYLGWSHGLAAIVLFLTQLLATGFSYRRAEVLEVLAGACHYLTLPHNFSGHNQYPDVIGQRDPSNTLNLCYGDLGIGFALLQAAAMLNDDGQRQKALCSLLIAAGRRGAAQCNVFDASFIYGASGNALFFKYMQGIFPAQLAFGTAATYWYEQAQELSQYPGRVAGYKGHYNQHVASSHNSLFDGLAGFGLLLIEFQLGSISHLPLLGYSSCS